MSISPQVRDVSVAPSNSCNCCDNVSCCIPFGSRRTVDIKIIRTADEALQKNQDSPQTVIPIALKRSSSTRDLRKLDS